MQKNRLRRENQKDTQADADASEESEGAYKDGTYEGEADGFGGPIQVKVTVENGEITDIESGICGKKKMEAYLTMANGCDSKFNRGSVSRCRYDKWSNI